MLLLALDTSTRQASLALMTEAELYGEYTWHIGNHHSVELLDRMHRLLTECAMTMQEIEGIAVAIGPGSFNGVRVALATAKTLAFVLKKPLVGVSTLDVIAAQQRQWQGPICALLEAGRSELYMACYLFETLIGESGDVTYSVSRMCDYQLLSPEQLASFLREQCKDWFAPQGASQPPLLFCGEISTATRQALCTHMPRQCLFVDGVQSARRASTLALLALQRLREGKEDDPLLLEPLYLRRPSITTSMRKQPLLGGKSTTGQSKTEREEGALRH